MMLTMVCVASSAQHKRSDLLLKFQERHVDIAPFFEDFPYSLESKNLPMCLIFMLGISVPTEHALLM